ncbi:phage virion morphogenesis protein [Gluconacetobacter azotocaptans]|uniref:phage virion morphogenesis protein n=1 Tax=Gluconacetobacter azotocaptans TaxID=142834 RepID=UPI001957C070|nr:phage virion morphogenesis protein [Gluconacetobacter azotocaptans]MBM9400372.1 phage virion morphogenesis protein [Gluconacetobacter azotocaptans]
MTMFRIDGSAARIRQALSAIADIGRRPGPVLAAIAVGLEDNVHDRFRNEEDPRGIKWDTYAPLNPVYAMTKEGEGILRGPNMFLFNSIRSGADGNTAWVGSDLKYAGVHQFGAIIQPRNKRHLSFEMGGKLWHLDSVEIPARPYLGFSAKDRDMVTGELEDFLARAMRA